MLMRDRRLVGPEEPLDLVVLALWDDRGGIKACRLTSSLERAGGESSRCLYAKSQNWYKHTHTLVKLGGITRIGRTQRDTSAFHAD